MIFADEPTGNLDSASREEVLELLRRSVDELRPDDRDGHARRRARPRMADRILFLADGRIVRDLEESTAAEVLAAMQEVSSADDARRAQGPRSAARSARVLTALAIVLGVAMVSGSFVLTDTISKAFDDDLHAAVRAHRRRRQRQEARRLLVERQRARFAAAAREDPQAARRRRRPRGAIIDLNGDSDAARS